MTSNITQKEKDMIIEVAIDAVKRSSIGPACAITHCGTDYKNEVGSIEVYFDKYGGSPYVSYMEKPPYYFKGGEQVTLYYARKEGHECDEILHDKNCEVVNACVTIW